MAVKFMNSVRKGRAEPYLGQAVHPMKSCELKSRSKFSVPPPVIKFMTVTNEVSFEHTMPVPVVRARPRTVPRNGTGSTPGSACAPLRPPAPLSALQPGLCTALYSGARFRGQQTCRGSAYDVHIVLQHVSIEDSYVCGYLKIKGLTEGKFKSFSKYAKSFNSDKCDYGGLARSDYICMRWKEQFLIPDHTIKDVSGASFAGFYYICFQKSTATVEGYYYRRSSEWYQSLNLNILKERSIPIFKFR